jgi:hypothetical protein
VALFLACRSLWPYAGRHPRGRTPLSQSPTITRSPAPLPVEPRPDFLPPISSTHALRHYIGQHSMSWRYLGSGRWRNYLGLWIGNGLGGIACALVLSVSVLACLWFSRVLSRSFAFVCLSLACLCLSLLVFGFRRRPTGIGRAGSPYSRAWRSFGRRLYIRRLCTYSEFFTQQFTLLFTLSSAPFHKALAPSTSILCTRNVYLASAIPYHTNIT